MSPSRESPDVVVIGGGVVGCAVARVAARGGARVVVLDAGEGAEGVRGAASTAAGGMLSPLGEADRAGPFLRLALQALERYPAFVEALEEETGVDVGLRREGKLYVAIDEADERRLRERAAWQAEAGHDVRWLESDEARALESELAPDLRGALLLGGEGSVDNRRLLGALRTSVERAGAGLRCGARVSEVLLGGGRATGVRLERGEEVPAGCVVVAAGAWSGTIGGLPRPLPVRPVKGQMVGVGAEERLSRTVSGAGAYLVPRDAGASLPGVWIGATQEEAGFDWAATPGGVEDLIRRAGRTVPVLAGAPVSEIWAGLRPGTPDELPVLGADPEAEGLLYATGHFRNGILLAPITGDTVGALAVGRDPGVDLGPFGPTRFGAD